MEGNLRVELRSWGSKPHVLTIGLIPPIAIISQLWRFISVEPERFALPSNTLWGCCLTVRPRLHCFRGGSGRSRTYKLFTAQGYSLLHSPMWSHFHYRQWSENGRHLLLFVTEALANHCQILDYQSYCWVCESRTHHLVLPRHHAHSGLYTQHYGGRRVNRTPDTTGFNRVLYSWATLPQWYRKDPCYS